jgi:hypothetical protein
VYYQVALYLVGLDDCHAGCLACYSVALGYYQAAKDLAVHLAVLPAG